MIRVFAEWGKMKRNMFIAVGLACACVTAAWIVQFRYGIGSCGPASNTPGLCLVFGMGAFYRLTELPSFARLVDGVPGLVAVGLMFLLPVILWSAVFCAAVAIGSCFRKMLAKPRNK